MVARPSVDRCTICLVPCALCLVPMAMPCDGGGVDGTVRRVTMELRTPVMQTIDHASSFLTRGCVSITSSRQRGRYRFLPGRPWTAPNRQNLPDADGLSPPAENRADSQVLLQKMVRCFANRGQQSGRRDVRQEHGVVPTEPCTVADGTSANAECALCHESHNTKMWL